MKSAARIHLDQHSQPHSHAFSSHAESQPNVSAILSVSALADCDDVIAAVRTAVLLAASSNSSLSVTVLDERLSNSQRGDIMQPGALQRLLSSVRTKLLVPYSTNKASRFALEATVTSASFLTAGSISLQVFSVDQGSRMPIVKR